MEQNNKLEEIELGQEQEKGITETDDEATEFNQKNKVIHISYKLTEEEALQSLKNVGYYKQNKVKKIVQTVILTLALIVFIISYIRYGSFQNIILAIICVAIIANVWFVPKYFIKRELKNLIINKDINLEIYTDKIEVTSLDKKMQIQLDGVCRYKEFEDMVILFLPNADIFPIPIKAIEPEKLDETRAILEAGTKQKQNLNKK